MVGSDQVPPERLQRALVEAAVEQFRDRTTTIGLSPSVPASCFARLGEKNQKQEQPRNEAQLHFVSLRSQFHYGARGGLSRVEMNALRAPLTALPVPKGICRLFLLDGADALIDDCILKSLECFLSRPAGRPQCDLGSKTSTLSFGRGAI